VYLCTKNFKEKSILKKKKKKGTSSASVQQQQQQGPNGDNFKSDNILNCAVRPNVATVQYENFHDA